MKNVYEILKERGFIYQSTDEEGLPGILEKPVTCYVGFDPTADSLHVGSLVPIMAMAHMQRAGHRVLALVGGATAMIGDPSGKNKSREVLTIKEIEHNTLAIENQLLKYFNTDDLFIINNADWLLELNYIEFLRDIGKNFSINRMLGAESIKQRLETGLSFIEFNYMLLQAYDFYVLMRDYDCQLQLGGQDQWGNIVAGTDLCRRMLSRQGYGITFPLMTKFDGEKFGKTVKDTIWLDAKKTKPFDFYQFWRNTQDQDVKHYLLYFTFLSIEECQRLGNLDDKGINRSKEILAYEITRIAHGREIAREVYINATEKYGAKDPQGNIETSSDIVNIKQKEIHGRKHW